MNQHVHLDRVFDRAFLPRAAAIYGASDRRLGSQGARIAGAMVQHGFGARTVLVNPRSQVIHGIATVRSATASPLASELDFALIAVPEAAVASAVEDCAAAGIGVAQVTASRFAEMGSQGRRRQEEVVSFARERGVRLLGPNCMGLISFHAGFHASQPAHVAPRVGSVSVIGQSGSVLVSLLRGVTELGLGLDLWVTMGNCADVQPSDLMSYLSRRPTTNVVIAYLEDVTRPDDLRAACLELRETGKELVVLKGGASARGQAVATSHTGAGASPDDFFGVLASDVGAVRVATLREAVRAAAILATLGRPDRSVAVVGSAGGQCVIAADLCARNGVPLAELSPETLEAVRALVPEAAGRNPIDLTPFSAEAGLDGRIFSTVARDPDVGLLVVQDRGRWQGPMTADQDADAWRTAALEDLVRASAHARVLQDAYMPYRWQTLLHERGIAVTDDGESLWGAMGAIYAARRAEDPRRAPASPGGPLTAARLLSDVEAARRLRRDGVPLIEACFVSNEDELGDVAHLGFPLVVKGLVPGVAHKTERGLVRQGVQTLAELTAAYAEISEEVREEGGTILVQRQFIGGMVELLMGTMRDDVYGVHVMVARGGIWTDTEPVRIWAKAPIDLVEAEQMLLRLPVGDAVFNGRRGRRGPLREAAEVLVRLAHMAVEGQNQLSSVELNPVIVSETEVVAVDFAVHLRDGADVPSNALAAVSASN